MQLFNFRCLACDHAFEDWDTSDRTTNPACPKCQAPDAKRLISSPRLDYVGMATSGVSSDDAMTSCVDKWAKAREQKIRIEKRNMERHGTVD